MIIVSNDIPPSILTHIYIYVELRYSEVRNENMALKMTDFSFISFFGTHYSQVLSGFVVYCYKLQSVIIQQRN